MKLIKYFLITAVFLACTDASAMKRKNDVPVDNLREEVTTDNTPNNPSPENDTQQPTMVTLQASDVDDEDKDRLISIPYEHVQHSITLKNMIADSSLQQNAIIPLYTVDYETLKNITNCLKLIHEENLKELSALIKEQNDKSLYNLFLAANYLDINQLLYSCASEFISRVIFALDRNPDSNIIKLYNKLPQDLRNFCLNITGIPNHLAKIKLTLKTCPKISNQWSSHLEISEHLNKIFNEITIEQYHFCHLIIMLINKQITFDDCRILDLPENVASLIKDLLIHNIEEKMRFSRLCISHFIENQPLSLSKFLSKKALYHYKISAQARDFLRLIDELSELEHMTIAQLVLIYTIVSSIEPFSNKIVDLSNKNSTLRTIYDSLDKEVQVAMQPFIKLSPPYSKVKKIISNCAIM